jgi:hypothetical protein
MEILEPNWNQSKPTWQEAKLMCARVELSSVPIESEIMKTVVDRLRASHSNGGALLASIRVGSNETFDWYASRNRLLEWDILPLLLRRDSVREALSELTIPPEEASTGRSDGCQIVKSGGFQFDNSFLLDGQLAARLYTGGAYGSAQKIEAREAKHLALSFCDAAFDQRFADVCLFTNYEPWTPWFRGIAWDWTAVLFDRRERIFWVLAVTDTD